ncbi:hypothetical protein [Pannonibacter tanglangensis]|nr:hypothetical protein [Pannonibacter sp. XCT-53]
MPPDKTDARQKLGQAVSNTAKILSRFSRHPGPRLDPPDKDD